MPKTVPIKTLTKLNKTHNNNNNNNNEKTVESKQLYGLFQLLVTSTLPQTAEFLTHVIDSVTHICTFRAWIFDVGPSTMVIMHTSWVKIANSCKVLKNLYRRNMTSKTRLWAVQPEDGTRCEHGNLESKLAILT